MSPLPRFSELVVARDCPINLVVMLAEYIQVYFNHRLYIIYALTKWYLAGARVLVNGSGVEYNGG